MHPLILPLFPAFVLGTINWIYWRKRGYSNSGAIVMSYIVFYAISYMLMKFFL
jgi:hypothetical protein